MHSVAGLVALGAVAALISKFLGFIVRLVIRTIRSESVVPDQPADVFGTGVTMLRNYLGWVRHHRQSRRPAARGIRVHAVAGLVASCVVAAAIFKFLWVIVRRIIRMIKPEEVIPPAG